MSKGTRRERSTGDPREYEYSTEPDEFRTSTVGYYIDALAYAHQRFVEEHGKWAGTFVFVSLSPFFLLLAWVVRTTVREAKS